VGGRPLIEHHVRSLRAVGVERIVVVVGHNAETIRNCLGDSVEYVENTRYAETNSLYSLWLARNTICGSFILMNCDVLAHPDVFERLLNTGHTALAYDSGSGDDAEHMKVQLECGMLRSISKTMPGELVNGENVGILRFDATDADELFAAADEIIARGELKIWAPAAVDRLAKSRPIRCVDVQDLEWVEIDFPEDLIRARDTVWPAISRSFAEQGANGLEANARGAKAVKGRPVVRRTLNAGMNRNGERIASEKRS